MVQSAWQIPGRLAQSPVNQNKRYYSAYDQSQQPRASLPTAGTQSQAPQNPASQQRYYSASQPTPAWGMSPQNAGMRPTQQMAVPQANYVNSYGPTQQPAQYPYNQQLFQPVNSGAGLPAGYESEAARDAADLQRRLLGPLADILYPDPNSDVLRYNYMPAIEAGLNYQNMLLSEQDRAQGYNELARAWASVGQSPESLYLKEQLGNQIEKGGPYTDQVLQQIQGGMKDQAAVALQDLQRQMAQSQAQRGLGGSMSDYQQAALQQQSAADLSGRFSDLRERAVGLNDTAKAQWLQQFAQQSAQEDIRRAALDELLANVFLNTERAPIDLGALTTPTYATNYMNYPITAKY